MPLRAVWCSPSLVFLLASPPPLLGTMEATRKHSPLPHLPDKTALGPTWNYCLKQMSWLTGVAGSVTAPQREPRISRQNLWTCQVTWKRGTEVASLPTLRQGESPGVSEEGPRSSQGTSSKRRWWKARAMQWDRNSTCCCWLWGWRKGPQAKEHRQAEQLAKARNGCCPQRLQKERVLLRP